MTPKQLKDKIFPIPKEAKVCEGALKLSACRLQVGADTVTTAAAVKLLKEKLAAAGITVCEEAGTVITLTQGTAPERSSFAEEAYQITITQSGVSLTGFGSNGVYYAVVSFVQLLGQEIPCCEILDWPDMGFRGHVIETRLGSDLMEKEDWFAMIDDFAAQKINHLQVNVYGCWVVQYDGRVSEYLFVPLEGYPELKTGFHLKYYSPTQDKWIEADKLPPVFEKNFFGDLVAYGYERGVKVFPGFNSYGHNTLIPHTYPELSAKDEDGNPSYSGFCTANPDVYKLLFSAYDQLIDKYMKPYGSDCIALQLDEVWAEIGQYAGDIFSKRSPWCKCPKCKDLNEGLLFVEHTVRLVKHLKEKGMKRVFICCDMLIDHGPNGVGVLTEPLLAALRREDVFDIVTITWWTYADLWEKLMFHTTQPETGLRRVTSPWNGYYHWCCQMNSTRDIYMLAKMAKEEGCDGMHSYSAYDRCYDRSHHLLAELCWSYDQAGTIQNVTDRYLRQKFPSRFEAARRAFQLFDRITEERIDQPEGNSSCLANYFMLRDRLSYYFYSYVQAGKPYPRIFPGEALQKVCDRKEDHIRAMYSISAMAKEAMAIWEAIAQDPACDREMAALYAYEANNYMVLVDDYLAMLRMMELAEDGEYALVKAMAEARRDIRIALMIRHEQVKASYQQPWNLRNHSIFMQFFEDLRVYLENTPAEEQKLDFLDMRYLASERFFWLR